MKDKVYIGELSKQLNISKRTILYYEDIGLIKSIRELISNYRLYEKEEIIKFMDLGRWITLLALYFIAVLSNIQIIHIYITILFLSTMDIFFNIASGSSIPNIVHKKNIIKINSIKQTISSLGSILAPSIGGIVISFISIKYFIIINAFSFTLWLETF